MKKFDISAICLLLIVTLLLPLSVLADEDRCNEEGYTCLPNPLKNIGIDSPQDLVLNQLRNFLGIISFLAICFVVFNGFKLVVAHNEEAITTARQGLTWSVGGFIVTMLAFTIVSSAAIFVGFDPARVGIGNDTIGPVTAESTFPGVVSYVTVRFLGILGIATVLMIVYYGFRYITSAGNDETVEQAKSGLKWAILGFIVTLLSYAIINLVQQYATKPVT